MGKKGLNGGEGGIRTLGTLSGSFAFEASAFNRALPPLRVTILSQVFDLREAVHTWEKARCETAYLAQCFAPSIPTVEAEWMDATHRCVRGLLVGWLSFAGGFEEEPGAALCFVDPVFEQACCCYIAGVVA
jgi:hypothetical protein